MLRRRLVHLGAVAVTPERLAALRAKVEEHTKQCGPCDFGLVEFGCSCAGDPRPLLLELLAELEALSTPDIRLG